MGCLVQFLLALNTQEVRLSTGSHIASCILETLTVSVGCTLKFLPASGMNNAVHTTSFYSLVSVYQLDTTETFVLPDIMKIIAMPKSLIPDVRFLHSILKNYPFFPVLLIAIQGPSSKSMNAFPSLVSVMYCIKSTLKSAFWLMNY